LCLAFLDRILPAPIVVVVVAAWAVGVAAMTAPVRHKALDLLGDARQSSSGTCLAAVAAETLTPQAGQR